MDGAYTNLRRDLDVCEECNFCARGPGTDIRILSLMTYYLNQNKHESSMKSTNSHKESVDKYMSL